MTARPTLRDTWSWFARPVWSVFRVDAVFSGLTLVLVGPIAFALTGGPDGRLTVWAAVVMVLMIALGLPAIWVGQDSGARRLAAAVRGFHIRTGRRTVLYHDPGIDPFEVALFQVACEQEVEALERMFGARLREWPLVLTRLRVYLFRTTEEVTRVYGSPAGGYANWGRWFVVLNAESNWRELIRHEIGHVFAGRWGRTAPRVLVEGLAVWAQRTEGGWPIDQIARRVLPRRRDPLDLLLPEPWPTDPAEQFGRYYVLAGSFTAYLIRRYGLAAYRRFYRTTWTRRTDFVRRFERHFGTPPEVVSRDWVDHLRQQPAWPVPLTSSL